MKKVLIISIFVFFIILCSAYQVNAYSHEDHEDIYDKVDSEEIMIEQLDSQNGKVIKGPLYLTDKDGSTFIVDKGTKGQPLWFHIFFTKVDLEEEGHTAKVEGIDNASFEEFKYQMDGSRGITYCDEGTNHMEYKLMITPKQDGNFKIKISMGDTDGIFFKLYIQFNNIEKTEAEKLSEKMSNAYKDKNLMNSSKSEDLVWFIASDDEFNDKKQISTWTKEQLKTKLDILKKSPVQGILKDYNYYDGVIELLEGTIEKIEEKEKEGEEITIDDIIKAMNNNGKGLDNAFQKTRMTVSRILGEDRFENPVDFIDVLKNPDEYLKVGDITEEEKNQMSKMINIVLTIITNIAMVVAVLMLAILGIKYMLGSVEEKAEYKNDMIPYLVGAILVFGICSIIKVFQQFGQSINNI